MLRQIWQGVNRFFAGADFEVQLGFINAAGIADCGNLFAFDNLLPFFDQKLLVVGICRNPAVIMADENKVAETFQFVSGINHGASVGCFDRSSFGRADVDAIIVAAFADCAVFGNNRPFNRPGELSRTFFYRFGFIGWLF